MDMQARTVSPLHATTILSVASGHWSVNSACALAVVNDSVMHISFPTAQDGASICVPNDPEFQDMKDVEPWVDYLPHMFTSALWVDYLPQMATSPFESSARIFNSHSPYNVYRAAGCLQQGHIIVISGPADYPFGWLDILFVDLSDYSGSMKLCVKKCFMRI